MRICEVENKTTRAIRSLRNFWNNCVPCGHLEVVVVAATLVIRWGTSHSQAAQVNRHFGVPYRAKPNVATRLTCDWLSCNDWPSSANDHLQEFHLHAHQHLGICLQRNCTFHHETNSLGREMLTLCPKYPSAENAKPNLDFL